MEQLSGMQVIKSKKKLIDNVLFVNLFECSFVYGMIDIGVHELKKKVDVSF